MCAVHRVASGETWVGQTQDVDEIGNRISFMARGDANPRRESQAAWNAHGAEVFAFEILERLEPEPLAFARRSLLDARTAFWREKLDAAAV